MYETPQIFSRGCRFGTYAAPGCDRKMCHARAAVDAEARASRERPRHDESRACHPRRRHTTLFSPLREGRHTSKLAQPRRQAQQGGRRRQSALPLFTRRLRRLVRSSCHTARKRSRPHRSDQAAAVTRKKKRKQRSEQISGDNSPNGCELCEGCSQTPPAHGRYARRTAAA